MSPNEQEERGRYHPEEDRSLSAAVLEKIEQLKGEDISMTDFQLYDDIDPDALNSLFRANGSANTAVQFTTNGVTVALWGDGAVEIRVTPRHGDGV